MPIGPGHLVLVVGPSGAGKDTLIDGARQALASDDRVVFARRIVTRAGHSAEDHDSLDEAAFLKVRDAGDFALWWGAHGNYYALPIGIDGAIRGGRVVVANVSRGGVDAARARYARVTSVLVTAPAELLAARLAGRQRDSDGPLSDRLKRNDAYAAFSADVVIDNSGPPADGIARLLRSIQHAVAAPGDGG
ncbi:MAG: phosphonate metabolism protein/1,5-bisphosphokinase (PRPP-forming) PhnN [Proteobacteria bacterium]|nr:phosphonate metabolism protein/1,5-bisphosphokinase (PRPP-forming) PhnN [Pseudomonadota bacterium]